MSGPVRGVKPPLPSRQRQFWRSVRADPSVQEAAASRICAELDTDVTYCKARVGGDRYGKGAPVVRFRHRGQGCNRPHPACSPTSPPDGRAAAKGWFANSADYLSPLTDLANVQDYWPAWAPTGTERWC